MIKRYHEAPLCMFDDVQNLTDGDYALVHLFETNPAYLDKFKQAVAKKRDVILDNSIFELGTAFDSDKFARWILELKPTWYIVPDSWKNGDKTVQMFQQFREKYPNLPGKIIGVAQGWTVEEVARSYKFLEPQCDMIAFNLDFSSVFYNRIIPGMSDAYKETLIPYCIAMSIGRFMVLKDLFDLGIININKPHHLLGCGVPQEVQWYPAEWSWIRSIDTSNPVIAGMKGWYYDSIYGINKKDPMKLCDHVNDFVDSNFKSIVLNNIEVMMRWCYTCKI